MVRTHDSLSSCLHPIQLLVTEGILAIQPLQYLTFFLANLIASISLGHNQQQNKLYLNLSFSGGDVNSTSTQFFHRFCNSASLVQCHSGNWWHSLFSSLFVCLTEGKEGEKDEEIGFSVVFLVSLCFHTSTYSFFLFLSTSHVNLTSAKHKSQMLEFPGKNVSYTRSKPTPQKEWVRFVGIGHLLSVFLASSDCDSIQARSAFSFSIYPITHSAPLLRCEVIYLVRLVLV